MVKKQSGNSENDQLPFWETQNTFRSHEKLSCKRNFWLGISHLSLDMEHLFLGVVSEDSSFLEIQSEMTF